MKKKYMAIVLGMSVALASVTGCGSQTEQTQTTVETTAESDASEETEVQAVRTAGLTTRSRKKWTK